jgi:hypothetical protein
MLWLMPADLRRERFGMGFISSDSSTGAPRSVAAAGRARPACRRLVHGRERSGGKGAKGGNLESLGNTGPADDVATRRKPAETGGNWRKPPAQTLLGKLSAVLLSHPRGAVQAGNRVALADIAENAEIAKAAVSSAAWATRFAAPSRRPRCLTGVGVAPILPHRKNGLKSRKHKAF